MEWIFSFFVYLYLWICDMFRAILPYSMLSHKNVSGQVILITGSGQGIGRLLAERFADLGARLVLWDINERLNQETAAICKSKGAEVFPSTVDIRSSTAVYSAASLVCKEFGSPDILINNAGILNSKYFLDTDDEKIRRLFEVNTFSHIWLAKAFLPEMLDRNSGHIVSVITLAGFAGSAGMVDYSASKFAAAGFLEALAQELIILGKRNINTTIVYPSFIRTTMINDMQLDSEHIILKPEYVADTIVEAVLTDQKVLIMPKLMYLTYFIKGFLPVTVFQRILEKNVRNILSQK